MKTIAIYSILFLFTIASILVSKNYSVDMSKVPNGRYLGVFNHGKGYYNFTYKAMVEVRNVEMIKIVPVRMPNRASNKIAKNAFYKMIKANDINIDATTQASYKGVVHNALTEQSSFDEYYLN